MHGILFSTNRSVIWKPVSLEFEGKRKVLFVLGIQQFRWNEIVSFLDSLSVIFQP
ncbi:hypothetical protein [Leptospira interrogans]|uniref:hypothetical protein n=1 Tax=Leptospira interrogans TaxID=173 RepID=UPI0012B59DCA|nr:hypothetical protein [Leptospira interrogans]